MGTDFQSPETPSRSRIQISTIKTAAVRLQKWVDGTLRITSMIEQDLHISEVIAEESARLRNFIR